MTHLSPLPPLPKRRQSRQLTARSTGQPFLLHGSIPKGIATASDPTTGQVFREQITHPETWREVTQSMALHNNTVAFGTATGRVSIVDINHRRKLDGGWKGMQQRHNHTVTALLLLQEPCRVEVPGIVDGATIHLVSASASGDICFHDIKTGITHRHFRILGTPITQYITHLEHVAERNMIIVGACTADVWILKTDEDTDPRQVLGTEYEAKVWDTPQDVLLDQTTGLMSPKTEIFFLSDIRNQFIFVIRGTSISRHGLTDSAVTRFAVKQGQRITSAFMNPDLATDGLPLFFAIGDIVGNVSIYNSRHPRPRDDSPISPLYTISVVPDVKITSLAINSLIIITGSHDGTSKVYSVLDGSLLRTLCAPNSRRRHLRPPSAGGQSSQNPITAISITTKVKSEVRGAIAFQFGHIRYWNFAPDGVGIVMRSKKRRRHRVSAKEMRGFVDDEIERDIEQKTEDNTKRKRWEKLNGGIEEEDVALQVALMMSREQGEKHHEYQEFEEADQEAGEQPGDSVNENWVPGRKISFGSTSGSASPATRIEGSRKERRLEDVALFRKCAVPEAQSSRSFEDDLDFAIRLSLAEQESRELQVPGEG